MKKTIKIVFGANINILKRRESIYGNLSYDELKEKIQLYANKKSISTDFFISNFEGELIEELQNFNSDALIINLGAFSHTSLSLYDTLNTISCPKIEVHLTNVYARGRNDLITAKSCQGVISGLGLEGFYLAIDYLSEKIR